MWKYVSLMIRYFEVITIKTEEGCPNMSQFKSRRQWTVAVLERGYVSTNLLGTVSVIYLILQLDNQVTIVSYARCNICQMTKI